MKRIVYLFTVLVVLVSCQSQKKEGVKLVNPTAFSENIIENEGQIIDVRTSREYNSGHIEGATNIHLYDKDFKNRIEELDKDKPVYVYCKLGGRSADAVIIMKEKGFKNIIELDGGIDAWLDADKPVVK